MARASSKKAPPAPIRDVEERVAEIKQMSVKQLHELWRELYGASTNTRNRPFLQKRLAFRVHELAEGGGLSPRAKAKAEELRATAPGTRRKAAATAESPAAPTTAASKKDRDPRLPKAGSTLEREYQGKRYKVIVHDSDFEYAGKRYNSLSTIAKEITGQVWNGFLYFGLTGRAPKKGAA